MFRQKLRTPERGMFHAPLQDGGVFHTQLHNRRVVHLLKGRVGVVRPALPGVETFEL